MSKSTVRRRRLESLSPQVRRCGFGPLLCALLGGGIFKLMLSSVCDAAKGNDQVGEGGKGGRRGRRSVWTARLAEGEDCCYLGIIEQPPLYPAASVIVEPHHGHSQATPRHAASQKHRQHIMPPSPQSLCTPAHHSIPVIRTTPRQHTTPSYTHTSVTRTRNTPCTLPREQPFSHIIQPHHSTHTYTPHNTAATPYPHITTRKPHE